MMNRPKANDFRNMPHSDRFDWVNYGKALERYSIWAEQQLEKEMIRRRETINILTGAGTMEMKVNNLKVIFDLTQTKEDETSNI